MRGSRRHKTGPPLGLDSIPGGPVAEALIRTPVPMVPALTLAAATAAVIVAVMLT
ncbi:hypothetical protein [Streptomyces sp. NPDC051677]|uniref:hypothetical protein n=1 Tax=Streptomyces sp. NPDC051677 TaxID=3365669 RepID=UPI0037D71402